VREGNGQHNSYDSGFNHKTECIKEINSSFSCEALGNQSDFVSLNDAIPFLFDFKNPILTYYISMIWQWYQFPCRILSQGIKF
jgi:hypothetical protein